MNTILILLIVCSIALGSPTDQISKRKPVEVDCHRKEKPHVEVRKPHCCGPDPCHECEEPRVHTKVESRVRHQEIQQNIVLRCSPGSYFHTVEYRGPFKLNTTATGFIVEERHDVKELYVARRKGGKPEILHAQNYKLIQAYLNGNLDLVEKTKLKDCDCRGDILKSNSLWLATTPLTGTCTDGVNQVQATNYRLNIYGKCCSECYLIQASNTYPHPLKH